MIRKIEKKYNKSKKNVYHRSKHNKYSKTKKTYLGGSPSSNTTIDLRQILLTKPIMNKVKEYDSKIDLTEYKITKGEHGFALTRMERMMESDFDKLLKKEPVELKEAKKDGKKMGTKIDGKMKKLYEIVNGRHRITRAIIENHKTIQAKIVGSP